MFMVVWIQIEEGKEIAYQLRAQIDALKQQLTDQEVERTELVNKMTSERRNWDVEKAQLNSKINQLDEQMAVFIQAQSKSKDTQFRMEVAWEKERTEHNRLLEEAQRLATELQVCLNSGLNIWSLRLLYFPFNFNLMTYFIKFITQNF